MKVWWLLAAFLAGPVVAATAQEVPAPAAIRSQGAEGPILQLDDVVREAVERSPEAQSELHTIEALRRRVPQVQSLPDPVVAVGWAGNLSPFSTMSGDPSSYRGFTISQQLPEPGKLKLQGQMAGQDAKAAEADYESIRRRIEAEVRIAWYDYCYLDKALQTTSENKSLLEKLSKIAEARYRVGKATQQDVLRSQVEISLLIEKLTVLEQQRATAQARIDTFLLRPPDAALAPAADMKVSVMRYSLDELYGLAMANDAMVLREESVIERSRLGVRLAQTNYRPDFSIMYMFQQRTAQPDMNGATVSVDIPVFYHSKQRQEVREASQELLSARKAEENRRNEIRFEIREQYLAARASEQLLDLYSKGVVPQSSLTLESAMAAYQVGNVDFLTLLASFTTLLNYETDYYRQLADHETAIARIEALTGAPITTSAGTALHAEQPRKGGD